MHDESYKDMAAKFVQHFVSIASATANAGGKVGMWDEEDGFFYGEELGASHQTGWTGLIARVMHFFATNSAEQVLELGKAAAAVECQSRTRGDRLHGGVSGRKTSRPSGSHARENAGR